MSDANGNFKKFVGGILSLMGTLLVAGVIGSIGTYAAVKSLGTDLTNFRSEVTREFDHQRQDIKDVEDKLDVHIRQTIDAIGGGGTS